jgi:hypothetical protein
MMSKALIRLLTLALVCNATGCGSSAPILTAPSAPAAVTTPDTWLATGQSNMEALAPAPLVPSSRVEVQQFGFLGADLAAWTPLDSAGPFSAVAGAFAADLADHTGRAVRVIAATKGGTPLSGWEAGGVVREYLIARVRSETIRGVILWQGESDALTYDPAVVESYGRRLEAVIADWRAQFGPTLPVILVGLQRYCSNWPANGTALATCAEPQEWSAIREAQRQVAASGQRILFVDVSAMTTGDLHPSSAYAAVARALAERAAAVVP